MKPIRLIVALFVAALLTAVAQAQPKVRYTLACYQPGSTTLFASTVKAGDDFDLVLCVQDLRPDGEYLKWDGTTQQLRRGVWAAYVDVGYVDRYATFRSVKFTAPYGSGKHCDVATPSKLGALGAFCYLDQAGTAQREVARVRFTAQWPASVTAVSQAGLQFSLDLTRLDHPKYLTLLIGNLDANPPEKTDDGVLLSEIVASGVTITITK